MESENDEYATRRESYEKMSINMFNLPGAQGESIVSQPDSAIESNKPVPFNSRNSDIINSRYKLNTVT